MKITVNNKEKFIPEDYIIQQLLKDMNLSFSVAIWVNNQQLLQKDYGTYRLKESDKVKIFKPIGGG
ncbi:sulfur carrier protein [Anaerovirgula multivorans]|uniref:Sulfur carrier protein n=1 Tax=Anaerovirgula multivorans TaxID=312168 RepID=A0A239AHE5_9FIRM|nr:sulfur carrier protein ThiS [Anaerovirgula multivorans]SNR94454.1 sulfur carrier protein [Anaerovirgula multivorans]